MFKYKKNIAFILVFLSLFITISVNSIVKSEAPPLTPTQRLEKLEPPEPKDISIPIYIETKFPFKEYSINDVLKYGKSLPLDITYYDPDWKRDAYKSYWHSTVASGRWSYVPYRTYYASHRLFTSSLLGSAYFTFVHQVGIADENLKVIILTSMRLILLKK